jgi:hypothetical protein
MFYHAYKLQMSKDATNALNSSGSWTAHPRGEGLRRLALRAAQR